MKRRVPFASENAAIDQATADWLARHDRGLTAAEQDAFSQWLAADPRHRSAWGEHRWGWEELDRLAGLPATLSPQPDPDLLAPRFTAWRCRHVTRGALTTLGAMAAAVVLTVTGASWWRSAPAAAEAASTPPALPLIENRPLADGSTVQLNRGALITVRFSGAERRVRLDRGEAHFAVAKDPSRPFVVEVAGVAVRAVGTAFNVRHSAAAVEVLVTSGQVVVLPAVRPAGAAIARPETQLAAGECASVLLEPGAVSPTVQRLSPTEIEARLSWQPRRLEFASKPLGEIVAEFNRRNPVRLTLADDELASLRLNLTFRSDNVEGFVRLLVSTFGVRAEWREPDEILLHQGAGSPP